MIDNGLTPLEMVSSSDRKPKLQSPSSLTIFLPSCELQTNANDETALHIAARYGHQAVVEFLIERAKANHEDIEKGNGAARQMLRMTNKQNGTALHEAVRHNHIAVVRKLTEDDPDFAYAANDAGETPLYMVVEREFRNLAQIIRNFHSSHLSGPWDDSRETTRFDQRSRQRRVASPLLENSRVDKRAINKENLNVQDIVRASGHNLLNAEIRILQQFKKASPRSSLQKVINLDEHSEEEEETSNANHNYRRGKEIDEGHNSKKDDEKKVNHESEELTDIHKIKGFLNLGEHGKDQNAKFPMWSELEALGRNETELQRKNVAVIRQLHKKRDILNQPTSLKGSPTENLENDTTENSTSTVCCLAFPSPMLSKVMEASDPFSWQSHVKG
ncbi:unnamed protein product [Dovyalis caffra]|uniref:Uncharacterized protein n=1 Tax=Dovyalis caffra TaxID=77055 RepID=A0AAV1R2F4_9ROSI|nr:unnamed protein product [Dovyalis caffra]